MTQTPKQTKNGARRVPSPTTGKRVSAGQLLLAKMEMVAARERGESGALLRVLTTYPQVTAELTEFNAALVATTGYEREELTPAVEAIAARARARAFVTAFPQPRVAHAESVGQRAIATLRGLRRARGLTMKGLAARLGLGTDVVGGLESGYIRAASAPERLVHALSDALNATADQIRLALQTQASLAPALLRSRSGASIETPEQPILDFAEAVRLSPSMTAEQKAAWAEGE